MFFLWEQEKKDIRQPAIRCSPHDTLGLVVQRMSGAHIHRIFVVDAHSKLLRVLSLRDIIAKFVKEPSPDYFGSYFWSVFASFVKKNISVWSSLCLDEISDGFSLSSKLGV